MPASAPESVVPPALLELRVAGTRVRGAEEDQLDAVRPALDVAHRLRRDPDRVPLLHLDHLVVELHAARAAHDDVHLLLLLVRVPPRHALSRRDLQIADAGLLELERLAGEARLEGGGDAELLGG